MAFPKNKYLLLWSKTQLGNCTNNWHHCEEEVIACRRCDVSTPFNCWNVPEISRVSQRVLGLKFIWGGRSRGRAKMKHFENTSMVQSSVYGFSTIISALQNLWAQSKAALSVPFSSQSQDLWVFIIFTSVLYLFLLGVLKQPSWSHLKEEKGDPKASFSTRGSCTGQQTSLVSTPPFCLK